MDYYGDKLIHPFQIVVLRHRQYTQPHSECIPLSSAPSRRIGQIWEREHHEDCLRFQLDAMPAMAECTFGPCKTLTRTIESLVGLPLSEAGVQ